MRILVSSASIHFSDTYPAGETQIAYGYATHLAALGHRVTVFSPRVTLTRPVAGLRAFELCPEFPVSRSTGYARDKFLWWKFAVRARRKAKELIREEGVDVIHHLMPAHEGKFSLLTGLGPPLVYGPMLLTWEEEENTPEDHSRWSALDLLLAKCVDRMDMHLGSLLCRRTLSVADAFLLSTVRLCENLGPGCDRKLFDLPFGVDTSVFHPNGHDPEPVPFVLFAGLIVPRKGVDDLVRAFSILKNRIVAKLVVIGGGDVEGVRALASDLGITDRVEVHGEVPFDRVTEYFERCTLFCLPSHGEPFGMVLLQAMASGKPVVATRGGGVDDIVDDGITGILVGQKRPAELAEAIHTLLGDPEKRNIMGEAARRKAVDQFEWLVLARRLESIYKRVIGG